MFSPEFFFKKIESLTKFSGADFYKTDSRNIKLTVNVGQKFPTVKFQPYKSFTFA